MAQKIIHWLLVTLVLSLGFGQLLRFEYLGVPIYLHDLIVAILIWLQVQNLDGIHISSSLKIFLMGLALGWLHALTLFPISDLLIPLLYTLRLLAYILLYLIIKHRKTIILGSMFLASGLVSLTIGLIQYVIFPDMREFQYLGWDDHLHRLTLPHFDPSFTGVMLVLALLSSPLSKSFTTLLFFVGILLTYARSVWLSLALSSMVFIKSKLIIVLALTSLLLLSLALPRRFGEGTNLLRTYSITSRIESDLNYFKKYGLDLLLGRGMNTIILDSNPGLYKNHATGPNNSYLYLLATTGVLGLLGWVGIIGSIFHKSRYKPMLTFFFFASFFNNVMFYSFALLWVLLVEATAPSED